MNFESAIPVIFIFWAFLSGALLGAGLVLLALRNSVTVM